MYVQCCLSATCSARIPPCMLRTSAPLSSSHCCMRGHGASCQTCQSPPTVLAARPSTVLWSMHTGVCCPLCLHCFINIFGTPPPQQGAQQDWPCNHAALCGPVQRPESVPWALKPLAAHTLPSTSCQGPAGMRMGAAGMSKACCGTAASALSSSLLCTRSTSIPFSRTPNETEAKLPAANTAPW